MAEIKTSIGTGDNSSWEILCQVHAEEGLCVFFISIRDWVNIVENHSGCSRGEAMRHVYFAGLKSCGNLMMRRDAPYSECARILEEKRFEFKSSFSW
jgi:hypothetical protein